jgi:hypothetical protein
MRAAPEADFAGRSCAWRSPRPRAPFLRDSLYENSYAPEAKIQPFQTYCTQSALAGGNRNCVLHHRCNPQLWIAGLSIK